MELTSQIVHAKAALDSAASPANTWRGFDLAWHATSCLINAEAGAGMEWLPATTALIDTRDALDQTVDRPGPALRPADDATDTAELRTAVADLLDALRRLLLAPTTHGATPAAAGARVRAAEALSEATGALR